MSITTIDKTNTKVTLGLAGAAALAFWYASSEWSAIQHIVETSQITLKEVKVQLEKINGTEREHDRQIAKLHEKCRDYDRRLKTLEAK